MFDPGKMEEYMSNYVTEADTQWGKQVGIIFEKGLERAMEHSDVVSGALQKTMSNGTEGNSSSRNCHLELQFN